MLKKRRTKGKLLIALGLLAGAAAIALLVTDRNRGGGAVRVTALPDVERRDVLAAEQGDASAPAVSESDDTVGEVEKKVDDVVTGTRRGRHAARE